MSNSQSLFCTLFLHVSLLSSLPTNKLALWCQTSPTCRCCSSVWASLCKNLFLSRSADYFPSETPWTARKVHNQWALQRVCCSYAFCWQSVTKVGRFLPPQSCSSFDHPWIFWVSMQLAHPTTLSPYLCLPDEACTLWLFQGQVPRCLRILWNPIPSLCLLHCDTL